MGAVTMLRVLLCGQYFMWMRDCCQYFIISWTHQYFMWTHHIVEGVTMGAGCGTVANTSCGPITPLMVLLWVRDAGLLPMLHVDPSHR